MRLFKAKNNKDSDYDIFNVRMNDMAIGPCGHVYFGAKKLYSSEDSDEKAVY